MRHRDLILDELQDFPHHFQDILRNSLLLLNHKLHGTQYHRHLKLRNIPMSNLRLSIVHCFFRCSWTQGRLDESNIIGRVEKNAVFPHIPTAAICASFFGGDRPG
ncbi:hypothetical protein AVEN_125872-1 [Araneus ventricosus]|uniref:Uncharacterized protein n=1 Tax=Araneus ventricosus TaxID=182803 RepID=A0A4Y2F3A1_ARAVE|nr:hypothetical protein AVEN_125872-1 [Araneus ventricosus]